MECQVWKDFQSWLILRNFLFYLRFQYTWGKHINRGNTSILQNIALVFVTLIFFLPFCFIYYLLLFVTRFFFFYLGFPSWTFLFLIHRTAGERRGYLFKSPLLLPPTSQALSYWPGDNCRELTSPHNYQLDSNRESLVSDRKSLTTKLRALKALFCSIYYYLNQIISNITVLLSGSASIFLEEVVVSILIKFFLLLSTPETNKLKLLPSKISSTRYVW